MKIKILALLLSTTIFSACTEGPYFHYEDKTKDCGIVTNRSGGGDPQGRYCRVENTYKSE